MRLLAMSKLCHHGDPARRLGVRWKEFRPSDGVVRAEGGYYYHVIISIIVRDLEMALRSGEWSYRHPHRSCQNQADTLISLLTAHIGFEFWPSLSLVIAPYRRIKNNSRGVCSAHLDCPRTKAHHWGRLENSR